MISFLPLTPLAARVGITCLVAQATFTLLFDKRAKIIPEGPWTHLAGFTAHQLVALPLMIMSTFVGWRDWFFDIEKVDDGASAFDRIFGYSNPIDLPLAVGSGAILLWDIPTGFLSPPLRDPLMWAHHLGMFLVAATMSGLFCERGTMIGCYYSSYYFGVIELSSIFLAYVDVFHPKHKHYYDWIHKKHDEKRLRSLAKTLNNANELARTLFAMTFLILRGLYFPYVSFRLAIPDLLEAYKNPPADVPLWTGYVLVCMISSFSILQAYWGWLIAGHVKEAVSRRSSKDSIGKKKK